MTKVSRIITTRPTTRAHLNRSLVFPCFFFSLFGRHASPALPPPSLLCSSPRERTCVRGRVFALRRSVSLAPLVCTLREPLTCYSARTRHDLLQKSRSFFPRAPRSELRTRTRLQRSNYTFRPKLSKGLAAASSRDCARVCVTKRASFRDFSISPSEGFASFSPPPRYCALLQGYDIRHVATAVKKCVRLAVSSYIMRVKPCGGSGVALAVPRDIG